MVGGTQVRNRVERSLSSKFVMACLAFDSVERMKSLPSPHVFKILTGF